MTKKTLIIAIVFCLAVFMVVPALAQDGSVDQADEPEASYTTNLDDPASTDSVDVESSSGESPTGDTQIDGFYCRNPEAEHPVISTIAERYGGTYEDVLGFFCGSTGGSEETPHYGLGVIMLAYETSLALEGSDTPLSAEELLAKKTEMGGWGQVWKDLGFRGRPDKGNGPPENAGKPDQTGQDKPDKPGNNSPGKPDHAGGPHK